MTASTRTKTLASETTDPHRGMHYVRHGANKGNCMCTKPCCLGPRGCRCRGCAGIGHAGCLRATERKHPQ